MGEGGMCVSDSRELNDRMRILRDHGMSRKRKYYHEVVGFNYRMTNMQAAIGVAQLERIDEILEWCFDLEEKYRKAFAGLPGVQMQENSFPNRKKIAWLVSVLVDENKRDTVLRDLKNNSIDARAFFIPLSAMDIYKDYAQNCIISRKILKMGINLPTTYEINESKIEKIVHIINDVL